MSHRLYIGLGSNVGARMQNLALARKLIQTHGLLEEIEVSPIYASPALLPKDSPPEWDVPFVNQVIAGVSALSPKEVLMGLQGIEREIGRQRRGHWAPREIDLDILSFGQLQMSDELLQIPHPEMTMRDFVLLPLNDIAPNWVHPVTGKNMPQLLEELGDISAQRMDESESVSHG